MDTIVKSFKEEYSLLVISKKDNIEIQRYEKRNYLKRIEDETDDDIIFTVECIVEVYKEKNENKDFILCLDIQVDGIVIKHYIQISEGAVQYKLYDYQLYTSGVGDKNE